MRKLHRPRNHGSRALRFGAAAPWHRCETLERRVLLATVVVDTSVDELNGNVTSIAALQLTPGGTGISLREAITAANNTGGSNVINFGIPGGGPHVININAPLPLITRTLRIDGYTQLTAATNTMGIGNNAALKIHLTTAAIFRCLDITAAAKGSVIRGLSITGFGGPAIQLEAPDSVVEGNWIGVTPGGVKAGNGEGVRVLAKGESALIGGANEAARNVIAGSGNFGVILLANGGKVLGNYIGTNPAGDAAMPNFNGVQVSASFATIGGVGVLRRNIISGNTNVGILITKGKRHEIVGNFIGHPGANGPVGNGEGGIRIQNGSNILIGSRTDPKEGNLISHNGGSGITVEAGDSITMRMNSIHHNVADEQGDRQLGIDLLGGPEDIFGTTANDVMDPDTGANSLQNWPVLMTADSTTTATTVTGRLNSTPNTEFIIDFYGNTEDDPSGHGEGESWFGNTTVITNGEGIADFGVPNNATGLPFISATATTTASAGQRRGPRNENPTGPNQTSEFSARVANARPGTVIPVSSAAPNGLNTYDAALTAADLTPGDETVVLDLPPGTFTPVTLASFLKPVKNALIDFTGGGFGHLVPRMFLIGGTGGLSRHALNGGVTLRGLGLVSGSAQQVDFAGNNNNVYDMFVNVSPEGSELGTPSIAFGAPVRFIGGSDHWFSHSVVHAGRLNPLIAIFDANNVWINHNRIGVNLEGRTFGGTSINENSTALDINNSTFVYAGRNTMSGGFGNGSSLLGAAVSIDRFGGNSSNVQVYKNSMFDSFGQGIDWNGDGVTPNDNPDVDGVPNFPLLSQAWIMPQGTRVIGSINMTPDTTGTVDAYASPSLPAIGTDEGRVYLGRFQVISNNQGNASFDEVVSGIAPHGYVALATITTPKGVSEFATSVPVQDDVPPAVDLGEFAYELYHSYSVRFDGPVDQSTLAPEDLSVQLIGFRRTIFTPDAVYFDEQTNEAVFSFFSPLPDGNYTATLAVGSVADPAGNALASPFSDSFFVLAGDANRDRKVDVADLGILASNWQQFPRTFSQADFNYDGIVDVADLGILASAWQKELAAPAPAFATPVKSLRNTPTRVATLVL